MRKFTILMALAVITTTAFAQISADYKVSALNKEKSEVSVKHTKTAFWTENFDGGSVTWTLGHDTGTKEWFVGDATTGDANIGDYMGWITEAPTSTTGQFAMVGGITDLLNGTVAPYNCWIQFDGINTTGYSSPKLSWTQNFRKFNEDECYVDYSTDGGANWTSVAVAVNNNTTTNQYGPDYPELILNAIGNQPSVSIRFRWYNTSSDQSYGAGYGWQIDDIQISATPENDLVLNWGVMNFFEGVDYTVAGNEDYFHYSSHYGMVPDEQYASTVGVSWFNFNVENKGTATVTPSVNVVVLDPDGIEVYNKDIVGVPLATGQIDTLDLMEDMVLGENPLKGTYSITYTLSIDGGAEDSNPDDNVKLSAFQVSDMTMARDMNNITAQAEIGNFSNGGNDTEKMATRYLYAYEGYIRAISVFIGSSTTPGTQFVGHIMQYETDAWTDITTTTTIDITEENVGTWVTVPLADDVYVQFDDGENTKSILAAVEIFYNGDGNTFTIGYDRSVKHSIWGTLWFFTEGSSANTFVSLTNWSLGGLGIRLYGENPDAVELPNLEENVNIYPNPASSTLNIENVEGANVQIVNMMGQVVENIEKANMVNTVDMSKYADGTYFVKVINGSEVSTYKVNLMK